MWCNDLPHWDLVTQYSIINFDNINSGEGLVRESTETLPQPILALY